MKCTQVVHEGMNVENNVIVKLQKLIEELSFFKLGYVLLFMMSLILILRVDNFFPFRCDSKLQLCRCYQSELFIATTQPP